MKNQILLIFFVILSLTANCQFTLTPDGFVDIKAKEKNHIVLEFPNLTQSQISEKVNIFLSALSLSPKDMISKVDSSLITVNGFCERCIFEQGYDMQYNILFRFKSGKIRIDSPTFKLIASRDNSVKVVLVNQDALDLLTIGIYNKKGVLKFPKFANAVEAYFNDYVQKLVKSISGYNQDDNW